MYIYANWYIAIAIDSTGIKVTNRGHWMQDKWNVKKKGYLKIHIAVDEEPRKSFLRKSLMNVFMMIVRRYQNWLIIL